MHEGYFNYELTALFGKLGFQIRIVTHTSKMSIKEIAKSMHFIVVIISRLPDANSTFQTRSILNRTYHFNEELILVL